MISVRTVAVTAAVVVASLAGAGGAKAGPCGVATYDTYLVGGFSCTIGDKTFSDFSYTNTPTGGAAAVPATDVTVNPIGPFDPGFRWAFGAFAATGQTNDLFFDYTVTVNAGGNLIDDAFEAVVGGRAGDGTVTLDEALDVPASLSASIPGSPTDTVSFNPTASVTVLGKDLFLFGGTTMGSNARASAVINRFSEVPEPATLALLGIGVLGLGVMRGRRKTG